MIRRGQFSNLTGRSIQDSGPMIPGRSSSYVSFYRDCRRAPCVQGSSRRRCRWIRSPGVVVDMCKVLCSVCIVPGKHTNISLRTVAAASNGQSKPAEREWQTLSFTSHHRLDEKSANKQTITIQSRGRYPCRR